MFLKVSFKILVYFPNTLEISFYPFYNFLFTIPFSGAFEIGESGYSKTSYLCCVFPIEKLSIACKHLVLNLVGSSHLLN